ncbi:unnamed protein product [Arabidopsis halleri]
MQQIEACHNIVGIPREWTIDLTGQTCPSKRAFLWKSKRIFFVTPQVLKKDILSGHSFNNVIKKDLFPIHETEQETECIITMQD